MEKKDYTETNKSIHIKTLLRSGRTWDQKKVFIVNVSDKKRKTGNSEGKHAKVLEKLHKRYQNGSQP